MIKTFTLLVLLTFLSDKVNGYKSKYQKPNPSNGPCIDSIEKMESVIKGSHLMCLGCYDKSQATCPSETFNCQSMIDEIYRTCDGVTLPQRTFNYDPPVSIYFSITLPYLFYTLIRFANKMPKYPGK
jgi:hypothetical protein